MINTNELMIGNFVTANGVISEIDSISFMYVWAINSHNIVSGRYYNDQIDPIPITPAVLEACNLDTEPFKSHMYQNLMRDATGRYDGYSVPVKYPKDVVYITKNIIIRNLHQLQNLYFTMTQNPLEIDIEKLKIAIS